MPNPRNLINGQKPEFGNPEHIKYHNRISRAVEYYQETGEIQSSVEIIEEKIYRLDLYVDFICVECGKENRMNREHENTTTRRVRKVSVTCPACKTKYLVELETETITKQQ
ncbi:hypothetical protein [Phaeodactylibacter sp.]|uniref:hypothetical protein n=1 Tax=Phaeodactylibacter sp. TaxID=1940289 RepID=UPI0025EB1F51|nr:hypothetical protein [Phaeodactylibacter sp.]MCI4650832.1 hypothetical protein [Phaeodactylibacter sp.]MCI5089789.1 hypothetical protein [Phaeodactylibacter sp.]